MRAFHCRCGQRVFFDSTRCTRCDARLGFDPRRLQVVAVEGSAGRWRDERGEAFRLCRNDVEHGICNWLVAAADGGEYCLSCRRTAIIPALDHPANVVRLGVLEGAKRHLLYSLLAFGLPLDGGPGFPHDLRFRFLEDRRSNPRVAEEHVHTGHLDGMVTINVREADDAERESTRNAMREPYRTLLGHFRHESGHYYFQRLLRPGSWRARFATTFGDPDSDYGAALGRHYRDGPPDHWSAGFISAYASAHPLEDWAETWAHYLHMTDTLETAATFDFGPRPPRAEGIDAMIDRWIALSIAMNALNRSMGLPDPYPFVLSAEVRAKITFVHDFIADSVPAN